MASEEKGPKYKSIYEQHKKSHHVADKIFNTTQANAEQAYIYAIKGDDKDQGVLVDDKGRIDYKKFSDEDSNSGKNINEAGKRFRKYLIKQIEQDLGMKEGTIEKDQEYQGLALRGFYNLTEEQFKHLASEAKEDFKLNFFEKQRDEFLKPIYHTLSESADAPLYDIHREKGKEVVDDIKKYTGVGEHIKSDIEIPIDIAKTFLDQYHQKEEKGVDPKLSQSEAKGIVESLNRQSQGRFSGLEKALFPKKAKKEEEKAKKAA